MKIEIEEYNPEWAYQFVQLKEELSSILENLSPKIEHIGSTSVPGLAAKPIIDILVGIENDRDLDKAIEPMINNHYMYFSVYNSVMPKRRFFVGLKDKKDHVNFQKIYSENDTIPHFELHKCKLAHIHIWEFGTEQWIRHIAFREYLRTHSEIKDQYEALKNELSLKNWRDGNEYNDGKDSFIKIEEAKAITWYNE